MVDYREQIGELRRGRDKVKGCIFSMILVDVDIFVDRTSIKATFSYPSLLSIFNSCFLAWKGPLTYILLPFQGVMFAFNFVCYVIVALRLVCSKEMGSTKTAWQIASRRVRNAVAIAFLLGMSWAFGFMSLVYVDSSGQTSSTNAAPNVFDVLFCVTLSMNGIVVFILFCLRRDEFWEFLRKFCKRSTDVSQKFNDRDLITNERTTSIYNKSTMPVSSNSSV